jgi:hypothetical protein
MTPNTRDIVIARVMLYCLVKIDKYKYQQISRHMGYSDGVCHKLASGGFGSELLLKCIRDYFAKMCSGKSALIAKRAEGYSAIFGKLLFEGVRKPVFLQFVRELQEDIGTNSSISEL